jgi:EAL domain-containing protein (putative c-di-GMP-specific phosphodiesterase class I)
LLDNAVAAIAARRPGEKTPVRSFTPRLREEARVRFLTEQDLRRAVANNEFRLHYQPIVNAALGRTVGAEALIRWQHPERGLVSPAEFIPIAEANGMIDQIGRWVLDEAATQLRTWADAGRDDLKVAVNISARQFRDPSLIGAVASAIRDNNLKAGSLEVELTETAAMQDRARARRLFAELRDLGVAIAIDDFGTGYSSISNLLDLGFDLLKIDRQFVTGVDREQNAKAICAALIALARGLKTEVLAEGVETEAEVAALRAMGVQRFQGFYFSRPLPAAEFITVASDLHAIAAQMRSTETPALADKRVA